MGKQNKAVEAANISKAWFTKLCNKMLSENSINIDKSWIL